MAAIIYSTDHQDQIALRVWNRAYSSISPEQKELVDNTSTPPTIGGGHALDAITQVNRYANFIQMGGSDSNADSAWLGWFLWEVVARCVYNQDRERFREARGLANDAMRMALSTYTLSESDEASDTTGWVVNHINIRRYVLDSCVRMTPMLLPTPERIDAAMRQVFVRIWNMSDWWFKRRQVTFTVDTNAAVTDDLAGSEVAHSISSTRLFYTDETAKGAELHHVGATEMAREISLGHDDGRPIKFRSYRTQSGLAWEFDRTPDQSYSFTGEVLIERPALATAANFNTALTSFLPDEHHDALRDMVLAEVVASYRPEDGQALRKAAAEHWGAYLDKSQDVGDQDQIQGESHTQSTFHAMFNQGESFDALLGGGML